MDQMDEPSLLTDTARHLAEIAEHDEPVLIERPGSANLVIVSERAFSGMQTTIELLSNPAMAQRLRRSLQELDRPDHAHAAE